MGLRIGRVGLILSFICPFFWSSWAEFVSQFSQEISKLESSDLEYICRMKIVL